MGYDIDRFTSAVDEGLLCSICRDVIEDGLQAPCEHAYCGACIRAWLVNENTCPDDRQALDVRELRPLFRYMRNRLAALAVRCRHAQAGCSEVCTLETLRQHEAICRHVSTPCPNAGCTCVLAQRDMHAHRDACPMRVRQCPRGCGLPLLSADDAANHCCVAELRTTVELLRCELTSQLTEQQREADRLLDRQRRHVTQRAATLQAEVQQVRAAVLTLTGNFQDLLETELRREEAAEGRRGAAAATDEPPDKRANTPAAQTGAADPHRHA